jgi:hypothetical protein
MSSETRTTKYFGVVELKYGNNGYGANHIFIYTDFKDQKISIYIEECDLYGDKLALVWEWVDKYIEIHEIAKKAIIENFPKKKSVVHKFFKEHFKDDFYFAKNEYYREYYKKHLVEKYGITDFEKIDITTFVEKMDYPSLYFDIEDGIITIVLDYYIYENGHDLDVKLNVLLDEKLNVKDFEIDWGS